jgi:hypothetical protein
MNAQTTKRTSLRKAIGLASITSGLALGSHTICKLPTVPTSLQDLRYAEARVNNAVTARNEYLQSNIQHTPRPIERFYIDLSPNFYERTQHLDSIVTQRKTEYIQQLQVTRTDSAAITAVQTHVKGSLYGLFVAGTLTVAGGILIPMSSHKKQERKGKNCAT